MTNREIVKAVLKAEKLTQVQFCEKIGFSGQGQLASMMSRWFSSDAMLKLLAPLGYEMVIRKKGVKKPTEYIVELRSED